MNKYLKKLSRYKKQFNILRVNYLFSDKYKQPYGSCPKTVQLNAPLYISNPKNVYLEDFIRIQPNVSIINSEDGKVIIKRYSAISAGCTIIPGNHTPTVGIPHFFTIMRINDVDNTIIIEEDVWVGTEVRILSKAKIGRGAIVATGSVITKEIPPYAVVAGIPSKIIAVKFSIDQIIEHEKRLYEEKDRLSKEYLESLFEEKYKGLKSLGENKFTPEELDKWWKSFDEYTSNGFN